MNGLFVSIGVGPGMGVSTAGRFAREGFDLVLAAREVSKLEQFAQQIRKETGRNVETVSLDATDFSAGTLGKVWPGGKRAPLQCRGDGKNGRI